jgi:hypothetical protein
MVRGQFDRFLKFLESRGEIPRLQRGLRELVPERGIPGARLHGDLVLDHRLLVLLLLRVLVSPPGVLGRQFRRSARAGKEKYRRKAENKEPNDPIDLRYSPRSGFSIRS